MATFSDGFKGLCLCCHTSSGVRNGPWSNNIGKLKWLDWLYCLKNLLDILASMRQVARTIAILLVVNGKCIAVTLLQKVVSLDSEIVLANCGKCTFVVKIYVKINKLN